MPNYVLNMPRLTITVTRDQAQWAVERAGELGMSISEFIRLCLERVRVAEAELGDAGAFGQEGPYKGGD